jgi:hypothetical protein
MGTDVIYAGNVIYGAGCHVWAATLSMGTDVIYAGNVIYGAGRHLWAATSSMGRMPLERGNLDLPSDTGIYTKTTKK